jgi:hypothetical protein
MSEIGINKRSFSSSVTKKAAPDITLTVDGKEVTVPAGEPLNVIDTTFIDSKHRDCSYSGL